jgi:hypothetical protein
MTANNPDAQTPMAGSELFIHNKDSPRAYWWLDTLWIVLADSPSRKAQEGQFM